jgi:DNA polymerase-3 subunit delta'
VIIDPADDLETGAVNALLKSLEEPPAGTFFLLVAHRIGRLLPTIRSRCRILRFAPLEAGQVDLVLSRAAPQADAATRAAAIAAAQGSPGVALDLWSRIWPRPRADAAVGGGGRPRLCPARRPFRRDRRAPQARTHRRHVRTGPRRAGRRFARAAPRQARIIAAHGAISRLAPRRRPTITTRLLAMEIGALLAGAAAPTEAAR